MRNSNASQLRFNAVQTPGKRAGQTVVKRVEYERTYEVHTWVSRADPGHRGMDRTTHSKHVDLI